MNAPWGCAVFISMRLQLSHGSLSRRAFVQAALALTGGRGILGALEGSCLVCLSVQISFDNWAGRDAGVHFVGDKVLTERAGSVTDTEQ